VFNDDFIDSYIELKMGDVTRFRNDARIRSSSICIIRIDRAKAQTRKAASRPPIFVARASSPL